MKKLFAALLLALFVACSSFPTSYTPPPPTNCGQTFHATSDFPESEKLALQRAAYRWNAIATQSFCVAEDGPRETNSIRRIVYRGPEWEQLSKDFGGADILGVYQGSTGNIGIVDVLSTEVFELVALHEFGHAHGLRHTVAPSVMHASIGTATDFTPIDLEECRWVGACPSDAGAAVSLRDLSTQVCVSK